MKIFKLRMRMDVEGDLVHLHDNSGRLSSYFIWNTGDGKFLNYTKPKGQAPDRLTLDKVENSDYLQSDLNIPIFSRRAQSVFLTEFPDEMEFHGIAVEACGSEVPLFLCKVLPRLKIIDRDRSKFRPVPSGSPLITKPAYYSEFCKPFNIARDEEYDEYLVVSENFVKVCRSNRIEIEFIELV